MPESDEYVAILRCQTWNVWPEKVGIEHRTLQIEYAEATSIAARLLLISYVNRTEPARYLNEETGLGPLIWDGVTRGLHRVRDTVLKAPEDEVEVAWQHRNAQRGEVDICLNFRFEGEVPPDVLEALRATAFADMSLLNLEVQDYLTPAAPVQLRKVLPASGGQMASGVLLNVQNRLTLNKETLEHVLPRISVALSSSEYGGKFRVALELYAAHFNEQQARVRFLLLVIAIESLASSTQKHEVAVTLLEDWQRELNDEMLRHDPSTEKFKSLEALSRELSFRAEDSIRSQVRKLFARLDGADKNESEQLQRRALRVYDKRSILVHDGYLPDGELSGLEREARELLEKVLISAVAQTARAIPNPA